MSVHHHPKLQPQCTALDTWRFVSIVADAALSTGTMTLSSLSCWSPIAQLVIVGQRHHLCKSCACSSSEKPFQPASIHRMKFRQSQFATIMLMLSLFWRLVSASAFATFPSLDRQSRYSLLSLSSSDEAERLKQSASKLREEAEAMRQELDDARPRTKAPSSSVLQPSPPVTYTDLKDSSWTFTYRFSKEPTSDDDGDEKKDDKQARVNYSGKLTVTLRADGYTDIISHEPLGSPALNISKVWGWDEEVSNEDDLRYLLFSVNTKSPEERFYWQARIDRNQKNEIALADGTVTIKKNVEPPGGFWGLFNGRGILVQFRTVGNFGGKPVNV